MVLPTEREMLMRHAAQRAHPESPFWFERRTATWDAIGDRDGRPTDVLVNRVTGESLTYYQMAPMRREAERIWHALQQRERFLRSRWPQYDEAQRDRASRALEAMRHRWRLWQHLFTEFGLEAELSPPPNQHLVLRHGGVPVCEGYR